MSGFPSFTLDDGVGACESCSDCSDRYPGRGHDAAPSEAVAPLPDVRTAWGHLHGTTGCFPQRSSPLHILDGNEASRTQSPPNVGITRRRPRPSRTPAGIRQPSESRPGWGPRQRRPVHGLFGSGGYLLASGCSRISKSSRNHSCGILRAKFSSRICNEHTPYSI
jgi:hypothetical protein